MNLEDVGNTGELIAAVGVIASLIYLSMQIRQNSREIIDSRTQSIVELAIQTRADIADGPVASIQAKIEAGEELSREEEIRYQAHRAQNQNIWELYLVFSRQGKVQDILNDAMESRAAWAFVGDGPVQSKNREIWSTSRVHYSKQYQDYVDELIRKYS